MEEVSIISERNLPGTRVLPRLRCHCDQTGFFCGDGIVVCVFSSGNAWKRADCSQMRLNQ